MSELFIPIKCVNHESEFFGQIMAWDAEGADQLPEGWRVMTEDEQAHTKKLFDDFLLRARQQ